MYTMNNLALLESHKRFGRRGIEFQPAHEALHPNCLVLLTLCGLSVSLPKYIPCHNCCIYLIRTTTSFVLKFNHSKLNNNSLHFLYFTFLLYRDNLEKKSKI